MPATSRYFIKSGMLFFMLSLVLGVLTQALPELTARLTPLFWHSLMVGWITQIIIGVSLWMFPGRSKTEDFRSQFLSWAIFGALNTGLILRIILEPFFDTQLVLVSLGLIVSAVLQTLAAFGYFAEMWPRVLSKEKQLAQKRLKRK